MPEKTDKAITEWIETSDEQALRAHIFEIDDREELLIEVPEWKTRILIKALSGTARSAFIAFQIAAAQQHQDSSEYWRRIWFELTRLGCMHPKTKKPIFKLTDQDDLMNEKNGAVLQMLGQTVQAVSGLDGSVVERIQKNLQSIPNSTSTTPSLNGLASDK